MGSSWGGGGPREPELARLLETLVNSKPKSTAKPVCFYCGQEGHIKPEYPASKAKAAYLCTVPRPCERENFFAEKRQFVAVKVNGKPAQALLDSGRDQTLVHSLLVQKGGPLAEPVLDISCVHGDHEFYPVTAVYLEVAEQTYLLSVGVVDSLAHQVILGQDIPTLKELLQTCEPVSIAPSPQRQTQGWGGGDPILSAGHRDRLSKERPGRVN